LIVGRTVMGLGAAASEPGTLSMIRQLYRDERSRNRALGVWAAVSGFSLALGPVLGGTLVGLWSWRGIFWFDVTFGLAATVVTAAVLPESSDPSAGRVDTVGTLIGAAALAALVFAIINGETAGFTAPVVLALFCVGTVAAVAFVFWERRCSHPLLDLRFLRVPRFVTPNVIAFCAYFATFAIFFFTALYLAEVAGYSGYRIAAVFLPMTVVMIAASLLAGRWITTVGVRWSLIAGCLVFAAGLVATNAVLGPHPGYLPLAVALAVAGAGLGACVVPVTSSVLEAVPGERSGMAASATNTSREVGAVAGVTVLGALVNAELKSGLVTQMTHLHLPAALQTFVVQTVETGGAGLALAAGGGGGQSGLVGQLYQAGFAAFASALHAALYLSAAPASPRSGIAGRAPTRTRGTSVPTRERTASTASHCAVVRLASAAGKTPSCSLRMCSRNIVRVAASRSGQAGSAGVPAAASSSTAWTCRCSASRAATWSGKSAVRAGNSPNSSTSVCGPSTAATCRASSDIRAVSALE